MNKIGFLFFSIFLIINGIFAQESTDVTETAEAMRVLYCSALNKNTAVQNIFVDETNTKWVASSDGLFEIYSADNAGQKDLKGNWSLLRQNNGNAKIELAANNTGLQKMNALQSFEKNEAGENQISTSFYDSKKKQLWIGTTNTGVYCYKTSSNDFRLLKHYDASNSKLQSDKINAVFVDRYGRTWIGSDAGVMMGEGDKWKLYEKESKIYSIVPDKTNVWLMGEDFLWKIDDRNRWMLDDMDERLSKGSIREIAYDSQGKLWVASDIITRFDVLNDKVEVYDASNGFTGTNINCIQVDQDDALWVGTDDGLFLIEREATMTISCLVEKELSCTGNTDDAALLVKVFGGTPPYEYFWNNSNLSGENPSGVGSGLFTVTVKDAEGITKKAGAKIEDNRMQVEIASAADASGGKNNGQAEVKVSGGVPGFKYKWDSGETKAKAKRLSPGLHQVTVSDRTGCEYVATVQIGGAVIAANDNDDKTASDLNVNFDVSEEITCASDNNASIRVRVDGGTAPYLYKWNKTGLEGNEISNLSAGDYTVTITDAVGKVATQTIYVEAPDPILVSTLMEQPVSNPRKRDGKAIAKAMGGAGRFSYEWDNGSREPRAGNLTIGKHTVTVTDDSGCSAVGTVEMTEQINSALTNTRNLKKGQTIRLEKLYFAADSTQITDVSMPTLNEIVRFMELNPTITIEIGGHTNNVPPQEYCDRLSSARAKSVAEYLVLQGVENKRVRYKGYGKRDPIASNNTVSGRKRNQRVEIKILDIGS